MGAKKMNLVLTLAIAFLFGAARCYGELRFNCSDKKIFLSKQFSLYYDTINPLHEVMIQKSLHKLRSAIGEKATVSRLAPRDSMELELEAALLEANEEMAVNEGTFRKLSRRIKSFGEKIKPKPKPVTTKHVTEPHHHTTEPHHHGTEPHHHTTEPHHHTTEPHHHTTEPHHHTTSPHHHTTEPHHETTTQHETTPNPPPQTTTSEPTSNPESTTTPRPAPVVTTTTQFVPDTTTTPEGRRTTQSVTDTTTTPEGRRTTQSVPDTTTTPEGRRTTSTQTTTPERRRTTSTQTTTPERRRTTSTQTTTPERRRTTAALPVVIDLELEVDMGRGASLLVTVDGRARQDRKFELVIDAPMTRLTADSLPGAIRGLEVMGQLMGTNQNGDKYLPVCRVH